MLFGERIRLRAVEREDVPRFQAWLNDPEVRANLLMRLPFSIAEENTWFDRMLQTPAAEHPMVIEIKAENDWRPIGNVGFHNLDWVNRSAEVGIFIGEKELWNQGYGGEVLRLMLWNGFENLNLNRVYLQVYQTNPRGIRCYEKVGFVQEGRQRQAIYKNGAYHDIFIMSVLRTEWDEKKK